MKQLLLMTVIGVAGAAAGFAWFQRTSQSPSPDLPPAGQTAQVDVVEDESEPAQGAGPVPDGGSGTKGAASKPMATPAPSRAANQELPALAGRVNRTSLAQMNALAMEQSKDIDADNFEAYETRARTGDGEAAFALFHKMMNCANAPATEEALLGRIEDIYHGSKDNPDQERMLDQLSDHYVQRYSDCAGFPRGTEGMMASFEWLQAAVDLRFPPALPAYVTFGKSIVQQTALRNPELVMAYRDRVLSEMEVMLSAGLPDAFIVYAREYASGDLLERNWFESYAYARAAALADPNDRSGDALLREAERHLALDEVRDARERARELCDRYCPN